MPSDTTDSTPVELQSKDSEALDPEMLQSRWIAADSELLASLTAPERDWLLEYGSLTAKIEALSGRPLQLDLLTEARGKISAGEARRLDLAETAVARIREVVLYGDVASGTVDDVKPQPWIFARTVIPAATAEQLAKLGKKPLGHFLFTQPGMERPILEVCRVGSHSALSKSLGTKVNQAVTARNGTADQLKPAVLDQLWVRRSLWRWQNNQMLVMEVFLADCPIYSALNSGLNSGLNSAQAAKERTERDR